MKDYSTLIIGLGAPILVAVGGLISWLLKSRKEELQAIEERALEKRIEIYNEILDPIVVLFSKGASQKSKDQSIKKISSVEYKKAAFNLITFGSDEMVLNYNEMMQAFFKSEVEKDSNKVLKKFDNFLLSIRKDVYNKNTKLKDWDMVKFLITDIEKIIEE